MGEVAEELRLTFGSMSPLKGRWEDLVELIEARMYAAKMVSKSAKLVEIEY